MKGHLYNRIVRNNHLDSLFKDRIKSNFYWVKKRLVTNMISKITVHENDRSIILYFKGKGYDRYNSIELTDPKFFFICKNNNLKLRMFNSYSGQLICNDNELSRIVSEFIKIP